MKVNVYVDGFNLYYGCVKGTPYKWLDLAALCRRLLPQHQINRIRYFTALVKPMASDPQKPQRQQTFIRALLTIPNLAVHKGHFLSKEVLMPLAHPLPNGVKVVKVIKTEEKGSDVNLATFLLIDGFDGDYEMAAILSNDSDLIGPIEMVQNRLGLPVAVFNPQQNTSWALKNVAKIYRPIRRGVIQASQFPEVMQDANGPFHKPVGW